MKHRLILLSLVSCLWSLTSNISPAERITELPAITGSAVDPAVDLLLLNDTSAGTAGSKKITLAELVNVPSFQTAFNPLIGTGGLALAKIAQAGATAGQGIVWNGTAWAPSAVAASLTSGPVTSSGAVSAIADAALSIAKTTGLQSALDAKVPVTRTVNNHPLSSDVTVTSGDVGLGFVPAYYSAEMTGVAYTATVAGTSTSDITVIHVISGAGTAVISVVLSGRAVTVTAGSATTTTTTAAAVNASAPVAALITASATGDGLSVIRAKTATALTAPFTALGGPGKVLQADANGAWRLGPVANNNQISDSLGGLFMSDKRRIRFEDQAGNYDASIYNWGDHNGTENELIMESLGRIALVPYRGMQFGPNDSQRYQRYIQMVSGNAGNALGADENLMPSGALMMQTKAWNAGSPSENTIAMQVISLGGTNSLVRFTDGAAMITNRTGIPTATVGDISGTDIAEIYKDGIWSPGTAPAPDTLTPAANIYTLVCSKYKTVQFAKMTLGATNTLAISGAIAGMRGVIYATQDATGGRVLTMPSGSALPFDWALSSLGNRIDRMEWDFDGTFYYWTIKAGLDTPLDSDASSFLTATGITDPTQRTAINNLALALKASGTTPNTLWEKTYRLFPFIGNDATKHRYELKTATAAGTFSTSGITHSVNGITGDGVNGYMRTGFVPSASADRDSIGVFVYNRTTLPADGGAFINGYGTGGVQVGIERAGVALRKQGFNTTNTSQIISQSSDFRGLLFAVRSGASSEEWGKVGGTEATGTVTSTTNCDAQLVLFGRYYSSGTDTYDHPSDANLAAAIITKALDPTERAELNTIISNYQTALGR